MKKAFFRLAILLLAGIGMFRTPAYAQDDMRLRIVGDLSPATMAPIIEGIAGHLSDIDIIYNQISPAEWTSRLLGGAPGADAVDLVVLSTPDLAVLIANEGRARPYRRRAPPEAALPQTQWREELFSIGFDPAMLIIRRKAIANFDIPKTRIDLARLLEQNSPAFRRRAGLVNIGLDNVSYTLAAQDSIRSPLFWRIARAFGVSQARIYDDNEELLQALSSGLIDLAYNVPLSDIRQWPHDEDEFVLIMPQDYVVALPWTVLVPAASRRPGAAERAIDYLLSESGRQRVQQAGLISGSDPSRLAEVQPVELGPELLVYLDSLKRSRFLDTWFQLVIHE